MKKLLIIFVIAGCTATKHSTEITLRITRYKQINDSTWRHYARSGYKVYTANLHCIIPVGTKLCVAHCDPPCKSDTTFYRIY